MKQKDVEENFWSMLNIVIPAVSSTFGAGAGIEPLCSFFSPFTYVLNAALPLSRFSKICQFLIDAVVVIAVFKLQ